MSHSTILLILGIVGLIFYAVSPILFPDAANIRQPELLPVYTLMIGVGGLLHKKSDDMENPYPTLEEPSGTTEGVVHDDPKPK